MDKLEIGDRIKVVRDWDRPEIEGQIGTVVGFDKSYQRLENLILVQFDAPFDGGHDGWDVGRINGIPDGDKRCRFFYRNALAHSKEVPAAEPVAKPQRPMTPRLKAVLDHLLRGLTLTQGEAMILGYGTRLSDFIHRLRARGHDIRLTMKEDIHGRPYGEYRLVTRNRNGELKKVA